MKRKLTLTIDEHLLPAAKRYAKLHGTSLSLLVERQLREVAGSGEPSFASRWRGKFRPAERADARYDQLAQKYERLCPLSCSDGASHSCRRQQLPRVLIGRST